MVILEEVSISYPHWYTNRLLIMHLGPHNSLWHHLDCGGMVLLILTFKWVPEPPIENEMESLGIMESASLALSEIRKTLGEYDKFKTLFFYMIAYFFFIDGINTVTALGGIFGTTVLGITSFDLMITILAIQFVAAPSAILFTKLAKKVGTKQALNNVFSRLGSSLFCGIILCTIGVRIT